MSSESNSQLALGMIEIKGLIGAIEAADAACKAAQVKLVGKEKIKGGILTIKIVGEVAAVRSAVDAGAAAAQKVGELIAKHVIPHPIADLEPYIYDIKGVKENPPNTPKTSENQVEDIENEDDDTEDYEQLSIDDTFMQTDDEELLQKLENMTVHELRRMARGIKGLSIYGREISKANKEKLITEIMNSRRKKE